MINCVFFHKEDIIDDNLGLQTTLNKYFKKNKNNGQND